MHAIFQSEFVLRRFLQRACAMAERLVAKASRKRHTTAQILREKFLAKQDEAWRFDRGCQRLASCIWPQGGARWLARWLQGVAAHHGGPLWLLGAPRAAPRPRPVAHAPLAAAAWPALGAGRQGIPASAGGGRPAPGGLRHPGGARPGPGCLGRDEQASLWGKAHPRPAPARGGGRASRQHAVPGRRRQAASARVVPRLS